MHARRDEPRRPEWCGDQLESPAGPEIEAPYFDEDLAAWVLSRHEDVLAAFRCPDLAPAGPNATRHSESANQSGAADQSDRLKMREETQEALSPALLDA